MLDKEEVLRLIIEALQQTAIGFEEGGQPETAEEINSKVEELKKQL